MMSKQRQEEAISIVGLGFVGLTTATVFASRGAKVIGIEENSEKIIKIMSGRPPFYEPGLEKLLTTILSTKDKGIFTVTHDLTSAIKKSPLVFITVGTPALQNGATDFSYLERCAKEIGHALSDTNKYHTVVVRSTVPPGTTANIIGKIISKYSNKVVERDYGLIYSPEFLREGSALADSFSPHVIVMGAQGSKSKKMLLSFYKFIYRSLLPEVIETTIPTAELIKYANNSFLATKISFINTIANICSKIPNTDVRVVAKAIGLDPRIGSLFLRAGPGYGGSCLPKDLSAFIHFCNSTIDYKPLLLEEVKSVNEMQFMRVLDMVQNSLNGRLENKQIAILGLAFKKDTDDIRESVSLKLIKELKHRGALLRLHDPIAIGSSKMILGLGCKELQFYDDYISCIADAECCVIMTEWDQYKRITTRLLRQHMKNPNLIDARRLLDESKFDRIDFDAIGLGKPRRVSK